MRRRDIQSFPNFSEGYRSRCELPERSDAEIALSLRRFIDANTRGAKSAALVFPAQKRNKLLWSLSVTVFLFAAGATLIGAWLAGRSFAVPVGIQPVHKSASQGTGLGMRVEIDGGNLRVSWNRQAPAAQSVEEAILQIDEGLQHRQLHLDAAQFAYGSLLYKPASDDVTFQLEIRGGTSAISQIVRVVDGSKPQTDVGSPGRPRLRTRGTTKRPLTESPGQLKAKITFQRTRALPRSSSNLQSEIATRPPDIQLASDQNAAPLPLGPANAPPEYSKPDRRTKFFNAIKHLVLPSAKLRESFQP